jgi:hypothetical protein
MPRKAVVHEGVTYPSLREFAKAFSLHYGKLVAQVGRGWTLREVLGIDRRQRSAHNSLEVALDGKTYSSLADLAENLGLSAGSLRARLYRGLTLEEAAAGTLKPRRGNAKKYEAFGRTWESMESFAKEYGLSASIVRRRLQRGWTLEQSVDLQPPPPRFRNFEGHARDSKFKESRVSTVSGDVEPVPDHGGYKLYLIRNASSKKVYVGITIGSLQARLKQHFSAVRRGRKSALCNAIKKYGESAFTIELIRDDAKSFEELQQQEIDEIAARNTIKAGYNTAFGGSIGTAAPINVNGLYFRSRAQAAEYFGVDQGVFNLRLNRLKWTPEQAAGLEEVGWVAKAKVIQLGDTKYPSIRAACMARGLDYGAVTSRLARKRWSLEQAFGLEPPPDTVNSQGLSVIIQGITFPSINKAAEHFGFNAESFRKSMKAGRTPDEALLRMRVLKKRGG